VFIDEFGALGTDTVITLMEMIRSLGGILVLATQTQDSLGDPSQQRRILGNVTTILQQMNQPEELVALGGTVELLQPRLRVEKSHIESYDDASATRARVERIDPNAVQRLSPGQAFVINKGRMVKVQMVQPPSCSSMTEVEAERGIDRDEDGVIVDGDDDDLARLIAWHGDGWRSLDPVAVIHTLTVLPPTPPVPAPPPARPIRQDDAMDTPLPVVLLPVTDATVADGAVADQDEPTDDPLLDDGDDDDRDDHDRTDDDTPILW
jgi:hypothetical protein